MTRPASHRDLPLAARRCGTCARCFLLQYRRDVLCTAGDPVDVFEVEESRTQGSEDLWPPLASIVERGPQGEAWELLEGDDWDRIWAKATVDPLLDTCDDWTPRR